MLYTFFCRLSSYTFSFCRIKSLVIHFLIKTDQAVVTIVSCCRVPSIPTKNASPLLHAEEVYKEK